MATSKNQADGFIRILTTNDTSDVDKSMADLQARMDKISPRAIDKTTSSIDEMAQSARDAGDAGEQAGTEMGQSFDKASDKASSLAKAIKGILLGYTGKALADYFIFSNADIESANKSLSVLVGSAEKASDLLNDLSTNKYMDIGSTLPIATRLAGASVEAEQITERIEQLGNVAQGNMEILSRISVAYSQMFSKGKVTAEDMMQIAEAGVNAWGLLADSMQLTVAEVQDLSSKGEIGINELDKALANATAEGGKYFGMLEAQADTVNGKISLIMREIDNFGREAGESGFGTLNDYLGELIEQIEQAKADGTLAEVAEDIGNAVAGTIKILVSATQFLIDHKNVIVALGGAYIGWKSAMVLGNTLTSVVRGVRSVIDVVSGLTLTYKINKGVVDATTVAKAKESLQDIKSATAKKVLTAANVGYTTEIKKQVVAHPLIIGATKTVETATKRATTAQVGYNVALAANPIILVLSALVALTAGLVAFSSATKKGDESAKELNNSFKEMERNTQLQIAKSESELQVLAGKIAKYDELRTKLNLTSAESSQLQSLAESLQSTFGSEVKVVDELTGKYNDLSSAYNNYAETVKNKAKEIEFQNTLDWYDEQINKEIDDRDKMEGNSWKSNIWKGVEFVIPYYYVNGDGTKVSENIIDENLKKRRDEAADVINDLREKREKYIDDYIKGTEKASYVADDFSEKEQKRIAEISEAYQSAKDSLSDFLANKGDVKVVGDVYDTIREKVDALGGNINTLIPITTQMANALHDAGAGAAVSFDKATGAASISLSALQTHLEAVREQVKKTFLEVAKLELDAKYQAVSRYGIQMSMSGGRASEAEKALYEKANQEYEEQLKHYKELESLIKSMDADYEKIYSGKSTFAGVGSKPSATATKTTTKTKTAAEIATENYKTALAYQKDLQRLGVITEEDYLKQISALRKKYSNMDKATFRQSQIEEKELKEKLAEESLQAKVKSYNDEVANQKWRLEIGVIGEKEYYKKLAEARKKYLKQGTDEWKASYKESFAYIKSTADEQTQSILESMNKVVSARDSAMQKMVDNAKLYTKEAVTIPETTAEKGLWKITTHEHTKEGMNTDNSRLREALAENALYEALRKQLIEKKANAYILETFDSLSVEDAILYAQSVLSKSSADWTEYNQLAGQVKSSSEARATRMYQSDVDDIKQGFVDKVNATFKGLTGDMALHGQSLVKALVDGWNEEFKKSGFSTDITLSSAIKGGTLSSSPAAAQLAAQQAQIAPEITISAAPVKIENKTVIELTAYGKVLAQLTLDEIENLSKSTGIQFLLN